MSKEKKTSWVKRHKRGLLIGGGILVSFGTGFAVGYSLGSMFDTTDVPTRTLAPMLSIQDVNSSRPELLTKVISSASRSGYAAPFDVTSHLRNLHEGAHPSAEKAATALANGFTLKEGQTWVKAFTKGTAA